MQIDVALNPAEIALFAKRDLTTTTCVIFDVLRATSSMITALAHGTAAIYPVRTIPEALALKREMPDAVLCGERDGELIDGFELGNSPLEYRKGLAGRALISTTTNGTVALRACEKASNVLVGALLNLGALAAEIQSRSPSHLLIVCAGTFDDLALEDAYAAGMLLGALKDGTLTDSAHAALAITRLFPEPNLALRGATNGRVLLSKGRAEEVDWCAQISKYNVIGSMEHAVIRALS